MKEEKEKENQKDKLEDTKEEKPRKRRISWKRSAIDCEKELSKVKEELQKVKDHLLRTTAEFQNYRKRVEEEKKSLLQEAKAMALKDLLHVFDMLDMALSAAEKGSGVKELVDGLRMDQAQWSRILENEGVEEVPGEGHPFDALVHDAIELIDTEELPPGTVARVLRKGFKLKGKVLRPAQVVVTQSPNKKEEKKEEEKGEKQDKTEKEKTED